MVQTFEKLIFNMDLLGQICYTTHHIEEKNWFCEVWIPLRVLDHG